MTDQPDQPDQPITYFSHIIGRFDRNDGVIHGVSIITQGAAKGHGLQIDDQTLLEVKHAAESLPSGRLKCKLNHRSGVEAVFGYLDNFRVEGPKLLGDLHMLKSHRDYEQTFEQLETLPNQIGLSVAFVGPDKPAKNSRGETVARCKEILSADLVPEPAANPTGLFESKVDTQNKRMTTDAATTDAAAQQNDGSGEISLNDIYNLMVDLNGRLEGVESFQNAIQAELEDAEGGDDDQSLQGDDGNASAFNGNQGSTANGGTDQNGGYNPHAAAAGAPAGVSAPVAAEFAAMRRQITELQSKLIQDEEQQKLHEFDTAVGIIEQKLEAVVQYATELEARNAVLEESVRTGVKPVKASPENVFLSSNAQNGDFEATVQKYVNAGKKRTEAVLLARKENPDAHTKFLQRTGVYQTL